MNQAAWVTGDTVYGGDYKLRSWLERTPATLCVSRPMNQRIGLPTALMRLWQVADRAVAALVGRRGQSRAEALRLAWQSLDYRWTEPGWKQWFARPTQLSNPTEIAYYFVFAPETVTLEQVVLAAAVGSKWRSL